MNNYDTYAINIWFLFFEINMVNIIHKDTLFLNKEQLRSLNRRLKNVFENPIFSEATFYILNLKNLNF